MASATSPVNLPVEPKSFDRTNIQRESTENAFNEALVRQATELLETHPHFRGRSCWVHCQCSSGNLVLLGVVPSFYLKQLAQEALRGLNGTRQIINRIQVVGRYGSPQPETLTMKRFRKPR